MLSIKAQYNLGDAKKYFREHLRVGDYYTEGQQILGQWVGQGAKELGLAMTGLMGLPPIRRRQDKTRPGIAKGLRIASVITYHQLKPGRARG